MDMLKCLCGREFNASKLVKCPACDKPAAEVRTITPQMREDAKRRRQEERAAELARSRMTREQLLEQQEEERRQYVERRDAFITAGMERIDQALSEGREPGVHTLVHMNVGYSIADAGDLVIPDLSQWISLGWDGWQIVATIPHTTGIPLFNRIGNQQTYAGGLGGMVDGVYLLLRYPITPAVVDARPEFVKELLGKSFDDQVRSSGLASARPVVEEQIVRDQETSGSPAGLAAAAAVAGLGIKTAWLMNASDEGVDGGEELDVDLGGFDF